MTVRETMASVSAVVAGMLGERVGRTIMGDWVGESGEMWAGGRV